MSYYKAKHDLPMKKSDQTHLSQTRFINFLPNEKKKKTPNTNNGNKIVKKKKIYVIFSAG